MREVALQDVQVLTQALTHGCRVRRNIVLLEVAHHGTACGHGHLITAESTGMGTGQPRVEPLAIDHHRQRQTATNGFGQHHHIRHDARVLKGKHLAGAGETALDFINDQRHPGLLREAPQPPQPVQVRRDHTPLALHHLNDHGGRQLHAGLWITEQRVQVMQVGLHPLLPAEAKRATVIVRVRHKLHPIAQQGGHGFFRAKASHQAQRPLAHAVITALERNHCVAPGCGAHQLQRRFYRVGAGGATKLDFRFLGQGVWQQAKQVLHKLILDRRGQVQRMQRQTVVQHLADRLNHHRVVMPERQGARACQAVNKAPAFNVLDVQPLGALQRQRNAPRVTARVGFLAALTGQQGRFFKFIQRFGRTDPTRLIVDKTGSD